LLSVVRNYFGSNVGFDAVKCVRVSNFIGGKPLSSEELGVLKLIERCGVVEVRGSVVLLTIAESFSFLLRCFDLSSEVHSGEDTVVRDHVVSRCRLEVVQVREGCAVRVTEVHGHVGVTVPNGVTVLSVEVVQNVVFDDRLLGHGGSLSSCGVSSNAISESKDVLVVLVLESVLVNINSTVGVTEVGDILEDLVGLGRRGDHGAEERLLDLFVGIDVSENGDLLSSFGSLDFDHFPSEHNLNVSLGALFESDIVSVRELINVLVGSPVHHASRSRRASVHLILSHEVLVVESVEVRSFSLVRSSGRVADKISSRVEPSSPVVSADSLFAREHVYVDSVFLINFISHFSETLNGFHGVLEAGSHNERFVSEFLTVFKNKRVRVSVDLGDRVGDFQLGPFVNASLDSVRLSLLLVEMSVEDGEVVNRFNELTFSGDESHLQVGRIIMLLKMLGERSTVDSTHEHDIIISALRIDIGLGGATTSESTR
jgi:hypothetical protein